MPPLDRAGSAIVRPPPSGSSEAVPASASAQCARGPRESQRPTRLTVRRKSRRSSSSARISVHPFASETFALPSSSKTVNIIAGGSRRAGILPADREREDHVLRTPDDLQTMDRRALVRADLNVPVKDGKATEDQCIRAAAPTIREIVERDGTPVVMSHRGKPKRERDPSISTARSWSMAVSSRSGPGTTTNGPMRRRWCARRRPWPRSGAAAFLIAGQGKADSMPGWTISAKTRGGEKVDD